MDELHIESSRQKDGSQAKQTVRSSGIARFSEGLDWTTAEPKRSSTKMRTRKVGDIISVVRPPASEFDCNYSKCKRALQAIIIKRRDAMCRLFNYWVYRLNVASGFWVQ